MVGVAGAGKTTMLAAVASAFEASGCQVLGTATAGQAARTLADGAALPTSSTLASLVGRLDRGQLLLDERSVVILDEAGMTDDVDLARLATHAQLAGAKLIVVGDHRQLGAVGPGGALAALVARHPDAVHHLDHNRRQPNPEERAALEQLRDSDINRAVDWYAGHDRIRPVEDRDVALRAAVDGWAADTATGAEVALLAWRRANVAELNTKARAWMAATGRLTGPELDVDGVSYRAADRVIALAPDRDAGLVTSQRAIVTTVDVDIGTVMLRTGDGRQIALGGGQLGADRLGHAYATTVHRFQGSTVERAHLFADGGGRELALCGHEPRPARLDRLCGRRRPRPSRRGPARSPRRRRTQPARPGDPPPPHDPRRPRPAQRHRLPALATSCQRAHRRHQEPATPRPSPRHHPPPPRATRPARPGHPPSSHAGQLATSPPTRHRARTAGDPRGPRAVAGSLGDCRRLFRLTLCVRVLA